MASLSEFAANIRATNVSRPYLFYVTIVPPAGLSGDNTLVSMYCNSAQTPTTNLMTDDSYYDDGILRQAVHNYNYQNLTLEFLVDMDYTVKEFFDDWMSRIVLSRRVFAFPDDYTADKLELNIISSKSTDGKDNDKVYKYTFNRIFPKTLNQVNLTSNAGGQPSSFTVDFAFESFTFSRPADPVPLPVSVPDITNEELLQQFENYQA